MLLSNDVTVLDIGSGKLMALAGKKTAKNIFNIRALAEAAYDGYQQGEWLSEESLFAALKKVLDGIKSETGKRVKKLYIGVPGEFSAVQCKSVSLNFGKTFRVSEEELERLYKKGDTFKKDPEYIAISWSAAYFTLDDKTKRIIEPVGLTAYKLTGLISYVLAERKFVNLFSDFLEKLGIKEIDFISTAWAETMSLFEAAQRDKYVLLADIGYMSTTVSQARGDGLTSIASFSLGGAHISGDIAEVLSIPFKTAEDIKEKVDLNLQFSSGEMYEAADKTKVAADITNEIVKARLEQMAEFLKRAIDKSELKCPSYVPLYLTGLGVSYIRGAKEFLAEKTGKNIEIVAPVAPGYNRPCRSSLISLLDVASNLDESKPKAEFFKDKLKRLLFGS